MTEPHPAPAPRRRPACARSRPTVVGHLRLTGFSHVARIACVLLAVLALAVAALGTVGVSGAGAVARDDAPAPTTAPDAVTTVPTGAGGGVAGDAAVPSNTPQPVGQPLPGKAQRLADSLIAAWILLCLVGGVTLAWWLARRDRTRPADPSASGPVPDGAGSGGPSSRL